MTDIDFDELDKAVHSLMGKVGDETIDNEKEKLKTLAINSTLKPDEKPQFDALGKAAEKIGNETLTTEGERTVVEDFDKQPTIVTLSPPEPVAVVAPKQEAVAVPQPTPAPAVKRPSSGRFMDMVNPAADMRGATPATASATPGRVPPPVSLNRPQPVALPTPTPIAASAPNLAPTPASTPPITPFLSDAKVEKRPLGGEAPTGILASSDDESSMPDKQPLVNEPEEEVFATMSINGDGKSSDSGSDDSQRPPDPTNIDKNEVAQEQQLQSIESAALQDTLVESTHAFESIIAVESGDTENVSKHSSTKMESKKTDNSNKTDSKTGSIYDVNNYHQPLAHPAKQKSGWGIVVIITVIILLAIAIAAAAYLFIVKP